jgi:hypothetical protein
MCVFGGWFGLFGLSLHWKWKYNSTRGETCKVLVWFVSALETTHNWFGWFVSALEMEVQLYQGGKTCKQEKNPP